MSKLPKALSKGEELLALHLRVEGIPFDREVQFAPDRKFRFDFLLRDSLAIEVDGGTRKFGRHSRHDGYTKDCEKVNLAVKLGYRVLRFTTEMVESGQAINDVLEVLRG